MTKAEEGLIRFIRGVMWRKRWFALADALAITVLAGGLISAAILLYTRLNPTPAPAGRIIALAFGVTAVLALLHWVYRRTTEQRVTFEIDRALGLEDRVASAYAMLGRVTETTPVRAALIEDAAVRVRETPPASVAPYHLNGWNGLALVGVAALVGTMLIPERVLPGGESSVEARVAIETAGEGLEVASSEIEKEAPPATEIASLAREQSELGRGMRRATLTRAEVLKQLNALEDRIRDRQGKLAETRADEVVAAAERRFNSALTPAPSNKRDQSEKAITAAEPPPSPQADAQTPAAMARSQGTPAKPTESGKESVPQSDTKESDKKVAQARKDPSAADPVAAEKAKGNSNISSPEPAEKPAPDDATKLTAQIPGGRESANSNRSSGQDSEQGKVSSDAAGEKTAAGAEQGAGELKIPDIQNPLAGAMAQQAVKALPSIAGELLKKAEQMRAGEISGADIQRLRQAAEVLMKDLSSIAQSKEFQQALAQMARQINPEQIEKVAQQLLSQEKIRNELMAAGRLLAQNQQAKDAVANLAQNLQDQFPAQPSDKQSNAPGRGEFKIAPPAGKGPGRTGGSPSGGRGEGRGADSAGQMAGGLEGKGKESKLAGKVAGKDGGEYLYLQTRAGTGAARMPYSSAYPQYRREAERAVGRSEVPPHLRSVVRSYFDAINPDAKKQK